jgi:GntR family transcriptional regulator
MFLNINPANGIAIYDQVVRQVKFAVAQGAVKPGNLVPSVREMARELAINPNTVARAYQQLQADGVLQQVRGMGMEVAADAVKQCKSERQTLIQDRIRQALVEAKQSGLDGDELRQIVEKQLTSVLRDGS